jgi:hypothetical protein
MYTKNPGIESGPQDVAVETYVNLWEVEPCRRSLVSHWKYVLEKDYGTPFSSSSLPSGS